ncbi:MAG: DUF4337 domain-containing protein [Acidobacteriaceae bacterium]|nr:DUF4337 domain-containing protein [Acidobacteriaceae bacterium]
MKTAEEVHEHAEHARAPFDKRVAATMAAIAAALAVVAVFGHLMTTEELLNQQKASDQWSYYQAKNMRRYESEIARDIMAAVRGAKEGDYQKNAERYRKEADDIQDIAQKYEEESHLAGRQALRLHIGEIFLEIGIVFASLAILTKRESIWLLAIFASAAGLLLAATTLTIH